MGVALSESESGGSRFENELEAKVIAEKIARGHAYQKHAAAFGNISRAEFESKILDTLSNPSGAKQLPRGRAAYWSDREQMIVVLNLEDPDAGTAFRPTQAKSYFNRLGEP